MTLVWYSQKMKKIIHILIFISGLTGLGYYTYLEQTAYSEKLKSIRDTGALRRLNAELARTLGNPIASQTNRLMCEEGGSLVIRVATSNNKKHWAEQSDELQTEIIKGWSEWAKLSEKKNKSQENVKKLEQLDAKTTAQGRVEDAIQVGLKKPFWVSSDKAAEDYVKSCLGR